VHKQRIVCASIAGFGLLTAFLPWLTVMAIISVSAMDVAQGWVVIVLFAAALAVSFTGPRPYALDGARQGVLSVLGLAAAGFGVWKYMQIKDGTIKLGGEIGAQMQQQGGTAELGKSMAKGFTKMLGGDEMFEIGFGLYAMIAAGLILVIAAWWKKRAA